MSRSVALARIWAYLRDGHLGGYRFDRHAEVGGTSVSLLCPRCRLIVDLVDDVPTTTTDARLAREGYRILRFSEQAVMCHIDDVCEQILDACRRATQRRPRRPFVVRVTE
jgi:very-short-patch-repair endonuclease